MLSVTAANCVSSALKAWPIGAPYGFCSTSHRSPALYLQLRLCGAATSVNYDPELLPMLMLTLLLLLLLLFVLDRSEAQAAKEKRTKTI